VTGHFAQKTLFGKWWVFPESMSRKGFETQSKAGDQVNSVNCPLPMKPVANVYGDCYDLGRD
jgi:hypothetical protein